ncbi:helix-turn-helix domain-containing protein [Duganella sp. BJB488]|uniref:helix-turn-helix domain-containing protein n=2 Tax=Duganella TaxID=75654 RepID=UPI000E346F90|nr:helix-turn-helix domain-containing protein [Duganella sp. BJB488]RFP16963.1 helix-turn-helix domain-containing protein [Duganella sp. BJB489]RFP20617.1 helix-turn-helix domain-containing protein [Duganella sp. BJB488]RFP32329.1 helix-turn-helix domain-containing protein [Duganella sp. BJB480]
MHQTATELLHSAPDLRTVMAHDADELASKLTNWQQSYDQISSGLFHGALTELRLPQLQVFRESLSQSVRQSCRVWPDAIWFGLPDHGATTRINGRQTASDWIMVQPGNVEFELVTPSAYSIFGIVASRELLAETARRHGCQIDWERVQSAELLQVDAQAQAKCLRILSQLLPADGDTTADGAAQWQDTVLSTLLDMLDHSCVEPALAASLQRRRHVVALAREYIMAHRSESITVPELCERVHVSRRTLQYCFEDVLGMSPMLYLRMVRLNGVRRQLQDGGAIGDVADSWGLSNFSQFSSDYRKLFGQCPSASLRSRSMARA